MKTINTVNAFELLCDTAAVILEDRAIIPELTDLEYDPDHTFLVLRWSENGYDFEASFLEGDNEQISIDGPVMTLINSDGDEEEIELLVHFDAEGRLNY